MNEYFIIAKSRHGQPPPRVPTQHDLGEAKRIGEKLWAAGFDVRITRSQGRPLVAVRKYKPSGKRNQIGTRPDGIRWALTKPLAVGG